MVGSTEPTLKFHQSLTFKPDLNWGEDDVLLLGARGRNPASTSFLLASSSGIPVKVQSFVDNSRPVFPCLCKCTVPCDWLDSDAANGKRHEMAPLQRRGRKRAPGEGAATEEGDGGRRHEMAPLQRRGRKGAAGEGAVTEEGEGGSRREMAAPRRNPARTASSLTSPHPSTSESPIACGRSHPSTKDLCVPAHRRGHPHAASPSEP